MERGLWRGREEGLEAATRNTMAKGLFIELASEISGLSIEAVKQIAVLGFEQDQNR